MEDEVWGGVRDWGLEDHSDDSPAISVDPVCGKQVDEAKRARKTSYGGVVHYFCSKQCQNAFERAPAEYTGRPHGPSAHIVDVNTAKAEDLKAAFQVNDDGVNQIVKNRPYQNWDDFKAKNPGFSDPVIRSLRDSGVILSTPDLNRIV